MGALLLPVGLYTEVSSKALSAGQGDAAGLPAGAMDAFAQVLASLSQTGGEGAGAQTAAAVEPSVLSQKTKAAGVRVDNDLLSPVLAGEGPGVGAASEEALIQLSDLDVLAQGGDLDGPGVEGLPDFPDLSLGSDADEPQGDEASAFDALALVQPVPVPVLGPVAVDGGLAPSSGALNAGVDAAAGVGEGAEADAFAPLATPGVGILKAASEGLVPEQLAAPVVNPGNPEAVTAAPVRASEGLVPEQSATLVVKPGNAEAVTSAPVRASQEPVLFADGVDLADLDVLPAVAKVSVPAATGFDAELAAAAGIRRNGQGGGSGTEPVAFQNQPQVLAQAKDQVNVQPQAQVRAEGAGASADVPLGASADTFNGGALTAPGKRWQSELPEIARAPQSQSVASPFRQIDEVAGGLRLVSSATPEVATGVDVPETGKPATPVMKGEGVEVTVSRAKTALDADANSPVARSVAVVQALQSGPAAAKTTETVSVSAQPALTSGGKVSESGALGDAFGDAAVSDPADLPLSPVSKQQAAGQGTSNPGAPVTAGTQKSDAAAKAETMASAVAGAAGVAALSEEGGVSDTDGLTMDGEFASQMRSNGQHLARTEAVTAHAQTQAHTQAGQAASQIASAMARTLSNGDTKFQMRLDPPELGRVEVHMKVAKDGSVQAHMIVDSAETLDMFMRDQRGLERALANAGLNTDSGSLQFSLRDNGSQGFASSQDNGSGGNRRDQSASSRETEEVSNEQAANTYAARNQSGLDVRI